MWTTVQALGSDTSMVAQPCILLHTLSSKDARAPSPRPLPQTSCLSGSDMVQLRTSLPESKQLQDRTKTPQEGLGAYQPVNKDNLASQSWAFGLGLEL